MGFKTIQKRSDLVSAVAFGDGKVPVRVAQISLVLWNLVFENQVAVKGAPCEFRDNAMVLMPVVGLQDLPVSLGSLLEDGISRACSATIFFSCALSFSRGISASLPSPVSCHRSSGASDNTSVK